METGRSLSYELAMLKAGVFDDFKGGATTLLVWGDEEGMAALLTGFTALREGQCNEFAIDGVDVPLTVCMARGRSQCCALRQGKGSFQWKCSVDTLELAADLVEPLLDGAGHQFMDVNGLAEQVIISRDEYSADLR